MFSKYSAGNDASATVKSECEGERPKTPKCLWYAGFDMMMTETVK